MKPFKTLKLSDPQHSTHLAYDLESNSLLVSGKSVAVVGDHAEKSVNFLRSAAPTAVPKPAAHPYLHFTSPNDPSVSIGHSGLSLSTTSGSGKYKRIRLSQSFDSGVHYFEVVCPVSCTGVGFGVEDEKGTSFSLKLRTTTPRVVGILIDLEQYKMALYTDEQLDNSVKEQWLSPGTWTPFVKIKSAGNVVMLNPHCSRYSVGMADEEYLYQNIYLNYKYANTVALLDMPDKIVDQDLTFLKENTGIEDISKATQWAVAKDKDKKHLKVALLHFGCREDKDAATKALELKGRKIQHSEQLWETIKKMLNKEKKEARKAIGITYKVKKTPKPVEELPATLADLFSEGDTEKGDPEKKEEKEKAEAKAEVKAEEKDDKKAKSEEKKVEEKKVEDKEDKERTKKQIKYQFYLAFKDCFHELNEKIKKSYKERVTNLLKLITEKPTIPKPDLATASTLALYLQSTDNILLVHDSMLKLLAKAYGQPAVPSCSFYNSPQTPQAEVCVSISKQEARYLLESMKWRALGEYMQRTDAEAVYSFIVSLAVAVEDENSDDAVIVTKYVDAKMAVDVALRAICLERLYRRNSAEYKGHKETRIFILTGDEDLSNLGRIFCKLEEMLWSMGQTSKEVRKLWKQMPVRLQSAYTRLLSFRAKEYLPTETALAEAGLVQREDGSIVHFEDLYTQVDQNVFELSNKTSVNDLWEELKVQLPDSKLLSGGISTNVPLHHTLNNFPPVYVGEKITSVKPCGNYPLILAITQDDSVKLYNTKHHLTFLLSGNLHLSLTETLKRYGSAKLPSVLDTTANMHDEPEDNLGVAGLFGEEEGEDDDYVPSASLLELKEPESSIEVDKVHECEILFNEQSIRTSCPVWLAGIVESKGKFYMRVRKYGYFGDFLDYALKQNAREYWTPFDDARFSLKEKAEAMAHIWKYVMGKAYTCLLYTSPSPRD
eukprot:TRINITY_DN6001_c0_g3_i1.p1 TRINITY_DN6001_c0_g3~~TRINITY_DN6001_c0_g3_i1.p1  ORF type:complete len:944 (+),score=265.08 TRINITY_DN6001_c0_g3_i1:159-2990(+)